MEQSIRRYDSSKFKKVFADPKYQNVEHVGGAGQGVNDKQNEHRNSEDINA